jgi:AraC family transcriptional regulator
VPGGDSIIGVYLRSKIRQAQVTSVSYLQLTMPLDDLLRLLGELIANRVGDHSLRALAHRSGWSASYLHRRFRLFTNETPKAYSQRLRMEFAAVNLAATQWTVLRIAIEAGFNSHEVFCRAFRRHFGLSPLAYRAMALAGIDWKDRRLHRDIVLEAGPCIRLYHLSTSTLTREPMRTLPVERRVLEEQPILYIRRRIGRSELQATLAECFGRLFGHAVAAGLPIGGRPTARYISVGPGLWTVDSVLPLMHSVQGEGEMVAGALPAGPAAVAITDPAETPDPARWQTEVVWPIAE